MVTAQVSFTDRQVRTVTATFLVGSATTSPRPSVTASAGSPAPSTTATTRPPTVSTTPTSTAPSSTTPSNPQLRSVSEWERAFLGAWNGEHTGSFLPKSTSGNSWEYYNLAYGIDANVAMYEATGKTQYLDRALLYTTNMMASARVSSSLPNSQFRDRFLGWPASHHPSDTAIRGGEYPLFESYAWRYVARMLRVMHDRPSLLGDPRYRASYDRVLRFTETNIFDKWMSRGATSHVYRVNTHMTSHWAYIALDLSLVTADPTRRAAARTVVNSVNTKLPNHPSSLRGQMKLLASGAYVWGSSWGAALPSQDVAHGNAVVAYIAEARDRGVEWTAADIRALVKGLDTLIFKGAGRYAAAVDGTGSGTGWFNDGFLSLGRYDAALQKRLESHTVGRNSQFFATMALNAKRLGAPA